MRLIPGVALAVLACAVLEREIKRVKQGRVLLVPGSPETAGHGTTGQAKWWKKELGELLQAAPRMQD
jgi:homoserine O-acetyltransferase